MDLLTGAMGSVASKLLQLLQDEYKLQKDVRREIKSLADELESICAALRKVAEVPWYELDEQVKIWARQVRAASYEMEDVLDTFLICVKGADEPADVSRLKQAMSKMCGLFTMGKVRHDIARAIKIIKEQVQEVEERRQRYRVDQNIEAKPVTTRIDPRLSALYTKDNSQLVGIKEPMDAVIELLSVGEGRHTSGKQMKIVSIVGFGGLGKTTLARAVYDKISTQFDCCAFVPVGQNPDLRKVLRDILFDLKTPDKSGAYGDLKELEERQLINELHKYLNEKRYFIVVDDIWNTSTWKTICLAFVECNSGSRILTTTRISQVSKEIGEVYRMEELSDNNSRKLFFTITFGGEERQAHNDELENKVCDEIIQKCRGIPLAIIAIAGVLARKPTTEWSHVYNSIGFSAGDDKVEDMKKILSYSFYDLPSYLKSCFLYLCVFPEVYFIRKNNLILRWVAEGFIHEGSGKEIFEVGDRYFHELINRNIVIPIEDKQSGLLEGCRIHDMLLRVIRQISIEEDFAVLLDREQHSSVAEDSARCLALHMLSVETKHYKDMGRVRSFYVIIGRTKQIPPVCSFKVLRVLALEFCIGMEGYSIEHIAKLPHLRYIGLSHSRVSKLPKQIGRLKFLQTLILDDTGIEELPDSVRLLKQLMCLRVDEKTRVPDWIGEMTSLVELEMYHEVEPDLVTREEPRVQEVGMHRGADNKCSTRQFVKKLGNLTNLRLLKTGITLQDQGQGGDFIESLRKLHNIKHISIILTAFLEIDVATESCFALSSSLCTLELLNVQFSKLPEWMNGQYLPNLCQLKVLVSDVEEQDLENLGTLPELRDLGLITIRQHRLKHTICGCGGFQNLRFLKLTVPFQFVQGAMPKLDNIDFSIIVFELKDANISFNLGLENLPSLESVNVRMDCADACHMEVEEAETAIRHSVDIHPNHPALLLRKENEDKIGPVDADSREFSRLMYKMLQDSTLNEQILKLNKQIDVQNNCNRVLSSQAQEMAHSLPEGHPSIEKIQWSSVSMEEMAILQTQLTERSERMTDTSDPNELMQHIKVQERLLELYIEENKRMDSIKGELKAALKISGNALDAEEKGAETCVLHPPSLCLSPMAPSASSVGISL